MAVAVLVPTGKDVFGYAMLPMESGYLAGKIGESEADLMDGMTMRYRLPFPGAMMTQLPSVRGTPPIVTVEPIAGNCAGGDLVMVGAEIPSKPVTPVFWDPRFIRYVKFAFTSLALIGVPAANT